MQHWPSRVDLVRAAIVSGLTVTAAAPVATAQQSRDGLLKGMQKCVAAAQHAGTHLPRPCEYVSTRGFVVMKERQKEHLFVPTATLAGVEDPTILHSNARPYWLYAWSQARHYFRSRKPWQIGLAINSKAGRSQDQLHIHMACMKKSVSDALHHAHISNTWSKITLGQHTYFVRHVPRLAGENDPFRLVYRKVRSKASQMQYQTIVVTGAATGFYILNDYLHQTNRGHGEELLDKSCGG
ncbi:MAG TPA: CDP-diacylglycerol diphosphatase [Hyphomicrobium sp.]|nr:CDP-diacylglycerol diphosphatase [Hyphomicrobium sp.]